VLVCYDLLGLTPNLRPKFVKRYAEFYEQGKAAARAYCEEVKSGAFPAEEHGFGNVQRGEPTRSLAVTVPTGYGPTH
jgi:3-methyl-2-oxobutanoate hydroxymethyltransferase